MPDVALDREVEGDLLVGDMGQGIPFRPGTFDGCIRLEEQHALMWEKKSKIFFFLSDILFLHLLAASPPCSGSVMQTRGHTVLLRDSTPSLVLYTPLW